MKYFILFILILMGLAGCTKTSTSSNSSSSTPPAPATPNPVTTDFCTQNTMAFGCPGYCQANPTQCGTSGTTNPTNPSDPYKIVPPSDNNWTAMYPGGVPAPSTVCPEPSGSGYDLRKGTITIAGGTMYVPNQPWTTPNGSGNDTDDTSVSYTHNISSFLVDPLKVREFLDTDSKLRVRFKVRPQPKPPVGKTWCFNRTTGQSSNPYGYKTLEFKVGIRGLNQDGTLKPTLESIKSVTAQVGGCTQVLDFSGDNQRHPYGVAVVVYDVYSDQGCWYTNSCTSMSSVKTSSCWSMDIEASVDGTKDI